MTGKNYTILRTVVTLFMIFFTNVAKSNYENVFFDHSIKNIKGENFSLSKYKHKVVLLVNVASYCGFTKQYEDLQNLWEKYKEAGLIVLGVPSNSFGQEKNSNDEVKNFCEVNFNISFPMTSIYDVKGDKAHEIYKWAEKNHGNSAIPKWNFYKILINKEGKIVDTFNSFTNPSSNKITDKIEKILN
tara:strand:- start:18 stop:578 length:561 start_codon:yes stop_codon:yes gene_type:complete